MGLMWLRIGTSGYCGNSNELAGSIKCIEVLD